MGLAPAGLTSQSEQKERLMESMYPSGVAGWPSIRRPSAFQQVRGRVRSLRVARDSAYVAQASKAPAPHRPRRTELKYCVPDEIAEHTVRVASVFLPPEVHARLPRVQRITSLYLDTPQLSFLDWHRERLPDRFKLRIRAYGEHPYDVLFAEVKRKAFGMVHKRRALLPADALAPVLEGRIPGSDDLEHAHALSEFLWRTVAFGASPKVLLSCVRESLRASAPGDETAVTVDRDLVCQPARRLPGDPRAWRRMPLPRSDGTPVLLEMKYGDHPPAWMLPLLLQLRPYRVSFSKYLTAMSHLSRWEIQ